MSWACGGRCACTEAGRSLLERYGMAAHLGRRPNPFGASHLKKRPPTFEGEGRPSLIAKSRENSALPALVSRCEVNHHLMEIQAFLIAIFFSFFFLSFVLASL